MEKETESMSSQELADFAYTVLKLSPNQIRSMTSKRLSQCVKEFKQNQKMQEQQQQQQQQEVAMAKPKAPTARIVKPSSSSSSSKTVKKVEECIPKMMTVEEVLEEAGRISLGYDFKGGFGEPEPELARRKPIEEIIRILSRTTKKSFPKHAELSQLVDELQGDGKNSEFFTPKELKLLQRSTIKRAIDILKEGCEVRQKKLDQLKNSPLLSEFLEKQTTLVQDLSTLEQLLQLEELE